MHTAFVCDMVSSKRSVVPTQRFEFSGVTILAALADWGERNPRERLWKHGDHHEILMRTSIKYSCHLDPNFAKSCTPCPTSHDL